MLPATLAGLAIYQGLKLLGDGLQSVSEEASTSAPLAAETAVPERLKVLPVSLGISAGASLRQVPKVGKRYFLCHPGDDVIDAKCQDGSLVGELRRIKSDVPNQNNLTVQCEDSVRYDELVRVIDACNLTDEAGRPALFPDVSVSAVN